MRPGSRRSARGRSPRRPRRRSLGDDRLEAGDRHLPPLLHDLEVRRGQAAHGHARVVHHHHVDAHQLARRFERWRLLRTRGGSREHARRRQHGRRTPHARFGRHREASAVRIEASEAPVQRAGTSSAYPLAIDRSTSRSSHRRSTTPTIPIARSQKRDASCGPAAACSFSNYASTRRTGSARNLATAGLGSQTTTFASV